jgi:hypothetical protein
VNGEYGGGGLLVKEHVWDSKKFSQYQRLENPAHLQKFFIDRLATVRAHAIFGLGAAVYTQTTDVEIEINGLLTYDRAVIKVEDSNEVKKRIDRLYPTESVASVIFASGLRFSYLKKIFYIGMKANHKIIVILNKILFERPSQQ